MLKVGRHPGYEQPSDDFAAHFPEIVRLRPPVHLGKAHAFFRAQTAAKRNYANAPQFLIVYRSRSQHTVRHEQVPASIGDGVNQIAAHSSREMCTSPRARCSHRPLPS